MNITNAKYIELEPGINGCIVAEIDGETLSVPIDPNNRHYAEIMRQVESGNLTIADAEE